MELSGRNRWAADRLRPDAVRVLNVGAGAGELARALTARGHDVVSLDVDGERLRRLDPDQAGAVLAADAAALPFPDGAFDAVFMLDVYEHIGPEFRRNAVIEAHRTLRAGGQMLFSTPNSGMFSFLDPDNWVFWAARLFGGRLRGRERRPHPHFSLEQIESGLERLFSIEVVHRGGCWVFPAGYAMTLVFGSGKVHDRIREAMERDFVKDFGAGGYNLLVSATKL